MCNKFPAKFASAKRSGRQRSRHQSGHSLSPERWWFTSGAIHRRERDTHLIPVVSRKTYKHKHKQTHTHLKIDVGYTHLTVEWPESRFDPESAFINYCVTWDTSPRVIIASGVAVRWDQWDEKRLARSICTLLGIRIEIWWSKADRRIPIRQHYFLFILGRFNFISLRGFYKRDK